MGQKVAGLVAAPIIDHQDNNVPKDATATRTGIVAAAVHVLQRGGVEGFTLDAVAKKAGVVKGLLLYHYGSHGRLLRAAAEQVDAMRTAGLTRALQSGPGMIGVDACWEELRRQTEDGTARAWLSICAAGMIDRSAKNAGFEEAARDAVIDGCSAALIAGAPLADVRDAYHALWLALLDVTADA
jgi:AcrR family transcriptional regulator